MIHEYTPPRVNGVDGVISNDTSLVITWDKRIWTDLVPTWDEWDNLDYFQVQVSRDGQNWSFTDTTREFSLNPDFLDTLCHVRVRAFSSSGIAGPWSEPVVAHTDRITLTMQIAAEYECLYADPDMSNRISVQLSDPGYQIDPDSVVITITGEGSNQNTTPAGADSIEMFWPVNTLGEVPGVHGLEDPEISGGIFSATVSTEEPVDPYFFLASSSLDGTELPYISFRLYSSIPSIGQFYWFTDDGFYSTTYEIEKGWHVYQLDTLAWWVSQRKINQFRIDPGTTGGANIKLDWCAVGSREISGELKGDIAIGDQGLSILTSPTADSGAYTVTVSIGSLVDSITIYTDTVNQLPAVNLLFPINDAVLEMGHSIGIQAEATDVDGLLEQIFLMINDTLFYSSYGNECLTDWKPGTPGSYTIWAGAIDNTGDTVRSDSVEVKVFVQQSYMGVPHSVPCIIEAEDYDLGGTLVAYQDSDSANLGGIYRQDGVDIAAIPGEADNYYVGWTQNGEWMEYMIDVQNGMKSEILLLVASAGGMGEFHLEIDDRLVTNHHFVGATGGDQQYDTIRIEDLYLPEGFHKLKLFIDMGGFNLDRFQIKAYEIYMLGLSAEYFKLMLYPNPARSKLWIDLPEGSAPMAEIWRLNGTLVKKVQLNQGVTDVLWIDDLPDGIYVLNLMSDGKIYRRKFVKL